MEFPGFSCFLLAPGSQWFANWPTHRVSLLRCPQLSRLTMSWARSPRKRDRFVEKQDCVHSRGLGEASFRQGIFILYVQYINIYIYIHTEYNVRMCIYILYSCLHICVCAMYIHMGKYLYLNISMYCKYIYIYIRRIYAYVHVEFQVASF